jgi:Acetyltransferase (GNAT) domain
MRGVRAAEEGDIPQIAELHHKSFGNNGNRANGDAAALRSHLLEVFCRHPWPSPELRSLVWEDANGHIVGSLGVVPREMWIGDTPIRGAVTHNFMVEPGGRSTLVAVEMLQHFFSGPQEFSIAEGNALSRRMWELSGGFVSAIHSIQWIRPLRPARFLMSLLSGRGVPPLLAWGLSPFCDLADLAACRFKESPFRREQPETTAEPLEAETLLNCLTQVTRNRSFRPVYDLQSLDWILGYLARHKTRGSLRKALVRMNEEIVGWYLYYRNPGGISEVVQLGAKSQSQASQVLKHLFEDARAEGSLAVSGQLEPFLMPALSEEPCLLQRGRQGTWLLVHSRDDRILRSLQLGDAFFSRLEGEWWIGA